MASLKSLLRLRIWDLVKWDNGASLYYTTIHYKHLFGRLYNKTRFDNW
jgi:hypothetical protein